MVLLEPSMHKNSVHSERQQVTVISK